MLSLRLRVLTPLDSAWRYTPWSVLQDGTIDFANQRPRKWDPASADTSLGATASSNPGTRANFHWYSRLAAFPMSLRLGSSHLSLEPPIPHTEACFLEDPF
jgi:hypothetical protein